ncbi:MAG TPA: SCO5389 family protein [Actinomycetota bacterium]
MSLEVTPALLAQAEQGDVDHAEFVACVRDSLPYAWDTISRLAAELQRTGADEPTAFADNQLPPPSEPARGQLLRALASDAIRGALERHFGVTLAFQNCHRVAVFPAGARSGGDSADRYREFTSVRAQLLNQSPALRDC